MVIEQPLSRLRDEIKTVLARWCDDKKSANYWREPLIAAGGFPSHLGRMRGTLLSDEERFMLSQALVEQNSGRLPVILGVAGVTAETAAKFARHARQIGADGVIAMPPYLRAGDFLAEKWHPGDNFGR